MGSFSAVGSSKLMFFSISIALGLFASLFISKNLNIILLGDFYAENLGLNIRRNSLFIIFISGYLTAIVTAYCGPIAFLGLAIPHLARFIFKTSDHKILIPTVMLIGMIISLLCNLIARMPGFEGNLPINAVTAFIGAPIVIWVILRKR
jgi:iron complex transport system permease protein